MRRLFVGLGNPGARYAGNRHNVGFMAVESIAKRHGFPPWRKLFQGLSSEGTIGGDDVQLLLPGTFMNKSGHSVAEALRHLKAKSDVVVFHDWLELPLGKLRVIKSGGLGGHNGLRSITESTGNDYRQVRIGIDRPASKDMVHDYVLEDFESDEVPRLDALIDLIADKAELLAHGDNLFFENKVRSAMESLGFKS